VQLPLECFTLLPFGLHQGLQFLDVALWGRCGSRPLVSIDAYRLVGSRVRPAVMSVIHRKGSSTRVLKRISRRGEASKGVGQVHLTLLNFCTGSSGLEVAGHRGPAAGGGVGVSVRVQKGCRAG